MKIKPQIYNGSEDLEDFLTQFDVTSEINEWNYAEKSLYLASSLSGGARAVLSELNGSERRDYYALVERLQDRYGSANRAEVFRTQLKGRVRSKGETIPELAQSIRKLARQAYPTASLDVVEALALDCFIDAQNESEIRLRLRELAPKSISEAEKIASRMEAHRLADKARNRLVGSYVSTSSNEQTDYSPINHSSGPQSGEIKSETHESQNYDNQNCPQQRDFRPREQFKPKQYPTHNGPNQNRSRNFQNDRSRNYGNQNDESRNFQRNRPRNFQNNGGSSFRNQHHDSNFPRANNFQGNGQMSSWRGHNLTNQNGPRLH